MTKEPDQENSPLVTALIKDIELDDGVNFTITLDGKSIQLINNTVHNLPLNVVRHLRNAGTPFSSYVSGQNVPVHGKRLRFEITLLSGAEFNGSDT